MAALQEIRDALQAFGGDPARVGSLASTLGFTPVPLPPDLLANSASALAQAFESPKVTDRFGVQELYRVADGPATGSALYLAVLSDWGARSSSRDRARRRVARAVVQNTGDTRSLILLVPNELERDNRGEIEVVMPRLRERGGKSDISTVRALVSTSDPSRFHVELLRDLAAAPGDSLAALTNRWRKAFSVERVTREFYQAYADVRDTIVKALVAANPDHPWVVKMATAEDGEARRREWATRQLGRVLFLWFLQSKRWLGYDGSGEGSPTYLVELWNRRGDSGRTFWSGMLRPLFFEAMAEARPSAEVRALLGDVPFLNGGLFRYSSLEDDVEELGGALDLPDEVFNPAVAEGQPHTVFSLLQRYRFTTRESTPDDQSVDPDPELLGRVFENLYQGDERHDSGTYYTPREIVHFMCRQALDGYLRDSTGVDQETLDWLRREVTDPEDSDRVLEPDLRERIEEALERVRICDPAVGSGAFLLGAMQEMVRLRKGMAHAAGEYDDEIEERVEDWKRRAIEHGLYGVDINPEAVEICQLRLWLSLVLDYQGHPCEVRPLPNLDFRIRVGDSLIDRFEEVAFVESLPTGSYQAPFELIGKLDGEHEKIERWLAEYEHALPSRQREIRDLIQKAKLRVLKAQVTAQRDEAASKVSSAPAQSAAARTRQARAAKKAQEALAAYEEALATLEDIEAHRPRVEKPFLWPLAFPEVFEDGGFDLVLANPPYVRMEHLDSTDELIYAKAFKDVVASRADLLVFFYARALHLLKQGGYLSFITSNGFLRRNYGAPLRDVLGKRLELKSVIDFGEIPVFDAVVEPYVLVARKGVASDEHRVAAHNLYPVLARQTGRSSSVERVREELEHLDALLAEEACDLPQARFVAADWRIEDEETLQVFDRLSSLGTPLEEFADGAIYMGVKTGRDQAFIIDQETREQLLLNDPDSEQIIRPWLRSRDVRRWKPVPSGLYVIYAYRGVPIDRFPAIERHLRSYRDTLLRRATSKQHPWYELQQPQEGARDRLDSPKVVWPNTARTIRFAADSSGALVGAPGFMWLGAPKWVVAVLNSMLGQFLIGIMLNRVPGGFTELKSTYLASFPIVVPDSDSQAELNRIVDEGDDVAADEAAARLYRLSDAERLTIQQWFERRSLPPAAGDEPGEDEDDD